MMSLPFGFWTALVPFLGGLALGGVSFAALAVNVGLYTSPGSHLWMAVGLHLVRICVLVGVFWMASQFGAIPLIAALGGYLAARSVATRFAKGGA